jgi:hypothetical protein
MNQKWRFISTDSPSPGKAGFRLAERAGRSDSLHAISQDICKTPLTVAIDLHLRTPSQDEKNSTLLIGDG